MCLQFVQKLFDFELGTELEYEVLVDSMLMTLDKSVGLKKSAILTLTSMRYSQIFRVLKKSNQKVIQDETIFKLEYRMLPAQTDCNDQVHHNIINLPI